MSDVVLVACAGSQDKWEYYLGVRNHFVRDRDGERILDRTLRLVANRDPLVIAPEGLEREYICQATTVAGHGGINELESSRPYWSVDGRTTLLLGDTFFTEEAITTIFSHQRSGFHVFGRHHKSLYTGSPWGEIFAYTWTSDVVPTIMTHLNSVKVAYDKGFIKRSTGWEVLYTHQGANPLKRRSSKLMPHVTKPEFFTDINDLTDDIDFPVDYHRHPMFGGELAP